MAWPPNCSRSAASTCPPKRLVLAAAEAGQQRERDDRRGHVEVDGLLDRPAALARVGHPAAHVGEVRAVLGEGVAGQLEQPRADDRAVLPGAGHGLEVDGVLGGVEDLEALRVGLHEPVLDAVVDHLRVVAGAGRAAVDVAALGRQRPEDGLQRRHRLGVAADHRAVAVLEAPDAAGDARVHEVDAALREQRVAALRVLEVGVAAIDDGVAGREERRELLHRRLGRVAGRHHEPDDARARPASPRPPRASRRQSSPSAMICLRLVERAIPGHHVMAGAVEPSRHVGAHAAEPGQDQVHVTRSRALRRSAGPRPSWRASSKARASSSRPARHPLRGRCARPAARGPRRPRSPRAPAPGRGRRRSRRRPGMGTSIAPPPVSWMKPPMGAPPLCSCPVEWR